MRAGFSRFLSLRVFIAASYPIDALKSLTFPILCIVGSEDRLILPAWVHQIAAALPDAQVIEISGTGHSPYFEDAATWNQSVLAFLRYGANRSAE